MSKVFFYVGANLLDTDRFHYGFEAATDFFQEKLIGKTGKWSYLLECTSDDKDQLTKKYFRLFAPSKMYPRDNEWTPPGKERWVGNPTLKKPLKVRTPSDWEFVSTGLKKTGIKVKQPCHIGIKRTGQQPYVIKKSDKNVTLKTPQKTNIKEDCSGKCFKTEIDSFVGALKNMPVLQHPVFSISDCNCFHTTGYIWGKYALDKATATSPTDPVLVINFDQHNDMGSTTTGLVNSDGWGKPLINNYTKAAYVVLGVSAADAEFVCAAAAIKRDDGIKEVPIKKPSPLIQRFPPKGLHVVSPITPNLLRGKSRDRNIKDELNNLWGALETHMGGGAKFKHYFIAIDRDCMFGNHTQWGDMNVAFENHTEITTVIDAIVETMQGSGRDAKLTGFDITGLPEVEEAIESKVLKKKDSRKREKIIKDLKTELSDYYGKFQEWSVPKKKTRARRASFSGIRPSTLNRKRRDSLF